MIDLDWIKSIKYRINERHLDHKVFDGGLFVFSFGSGIHLGNSESYKLGQIITDVCFIDKQTILVLIARSNEILRFGIDQDRGGFVLESKQSFGKQFMQVEESTCMAISPNSEYVVVGTRVKRKFNQTHLYHHIHIFKHSEKAKLLEFHSKFRVKKERDVGYFHSLIFHDWDGRRLIFSANHYNICEGVGSGEFRRGGVSTFAVDSMRKKMLVVKRVYLEGDGDQVGSWYRDGSGVVSLDNNGCFARISL